MKKLLTKLRRNCLVVVVFHFLDHNYKPNLKGKNQVVMCDDIYFTWATSLMLDM